LKAGKNMDISGNHRIATLMLYVTTSWLKGTIRQLFRF
jgi:hypothetical protein